MTPTAPAGLLTHLPAEMVERALSFLGLHDLARFSEINRGFSAFVQGNDRLWAGLILHIWRDKYVMRRFKRLPRNRETLKASVLHSKVTTMSEDDLESVLWRVRFHSSGSGFWFHRSVGKMLLRRFLKGGEYWHPPGDPIFSDPHFEAPAFTWETFLDEHEPNTQLVQLSGMPPHVLSRDERTWGWRLDSPFTYYTPVSEPDC